MITLHELNDTHRFSRKRRRIGRGPGSKRGKTCGRGSKGDKARSGYKRHFGHEGGQLPLYRKLPCRGFPNAKFRSDVFALNLSLIEELFEDGEVVSLETLHQKGQLPHRVPGGLKVLGRGELTKKVEIQARAFSQSAKEKLDRLSVPYKILP
jgi:large subunit ribosomal protein L15